MKSNFSLVSILITIVYSLEANAQEVLSFSSDKLTSNQVTCFCQDDEGYVWIGTLYGLNKFDGYKFTSYLNKNKFDSLQLADNYVTCLQKSNDGRLWIGTSQGSSYYDRKRDVVVTLRPGEYNPRIDGYLQLKNGKFVVGSSGFGLFDMDMKTLDYHRNSDFTFSDLNDFYNLIFEDSKHRFWKADNIHRIVSCFDENKKGELLHRDSSVLGRPVNFFESHGCVYLACNQGLMYFKNNKTEIIPLNNYNIVSACQLQNGEILLGTSSQGLIFAKVDDDKFEITDQKMPTAWIEAVFEDSDNNIWAGIHNKGFVIIPKNKMKFETWNIPISSCATFYSVVSAVPGPDKSFYCMCTDYLIYQISDKGDILRTVSNEHDFVTFTSNYAASKNAVYKLDTATFKATKIASFNCDFITKLVEHKGKLYVATMSDGLEIIDLHTGRIENLNMFQKNRKGGYLCNNWINDMIVDGESIILATYSGVTCYNTVTKEFAMPELHDKLYTYNCTCLEKFSQDSLIIGTVKGLFCYRNSDGTTERLQNCDTLNNLSIKKIIKNNNNSLWISTSNGIWNYNISAASLTGYIKGNGLTDREYIRNLGLKISDSVIVFGNSKGFVAFNPLSKEVIGHRPDNPVVTGVFVDRKKVEYNSQEPIVLQYGQNVLELNFSVFDFAEVENTIFEYSLNDNVPQTLPQGTNSLVLYNLPAGIYELKIRALQSDFCSDYSFVTIISKPPFYKSTIAYLIYLLIIAGIGYFIFVTVKRRKQQKIYEDKTQLLINATHDIRTPLTMIISPVEQLLKEETSEENRHRLSVIRRNADNILNLVNQILYLRKQDKNQIKLACRKTELKRYIASITSMFDETAKHRDVNLNLDFPEDDVEIYIDTDNFDKVIINLISNAFKYTPEGGEISVGITKVTENNTPYALITVKDSGQGLDEHDLKKIFTRFYQSGARPELKIEGTGIGLNICKMVVEQHHGRIIAQNREDKRGSIFSVFIPLGKDHLKPDEIVEDEVVVKETAKYPVKKYKLLFVDDDLEICRYISSEFSSKFDITICNNGQQAIKRLMDNPTDIVVSDIMMPIVDGLTLLRMIKTNVNINHIPVILLSGQNQFANRLEGLDKGADAFLAKPFVISELEITIKNLLKKNEALKIKYSGQQQQTLDKTNKVEFNDSDKLLIDNIMKCINENISNPDFNVTALAIKMKMSRVQIHRKLREFVGINASDLIRNIRLEQAGRLIKETKGNISEIAYSLGFNSPAHFSKVFKEHFGTSPTKYAESDDDIE